MRVLRSILFLLCLVGLLSAAPSLSLAADATVRSVVSRTGSSAGFANLCGSGACVATLVGKVINILLGLLGVALIGYILYAGYLWMTSGGESERAEEAQKVVRNAVIGVFVVGFSYTLSGMVLNLVTTTFTPVDVQAPDTTAASPATAPTARSRTSANIHTDPFAVGCVENECEDSCIAQECSSLRGQQAFTCESTCQTRCTTACRPRVNSGLLDCEQPRYDTCVSNCATQTTETSRSTCRATCVSNYCSSNGSTGSGVITDVVSCRDASALRTCYASCNTQSASVGNDITEDDVHNDPFDIGGPRVTVESLRAERRNAFLNTCNSQCLATNCR